MTLEQLSYINLPEHVGPGGFDHAAVHRASGRLYVAHTINDALDVIDCVTDRYLYSIPNLKGVAGALVSDENDLIFTSNRGENSVGIFAPDDEGGLVKVAVGMRPNGLAYAPVHNLLLAANVGDLALHSAFTISIVDVERQAMIADIAVPGRTRWTIYHAQQDMFFVNIADPAQVVVIEAADPKRIARTYPIPAAGPHGLDLDLEQNRLFCACDGQKLIILEAGTGEVLGERDLRGVPDVIFFNVALQHLYVAIGDPGVIEVFDTYTLERIETVLTEKGAHTLGFDPDRNKVYAFLPQTHRAAVYWDSSGL
jgi:DNA-binding beta-propeller fold protein YncE